MQSIACHHEAEVTQPESSPFPSGARGAFGAIVRELTPYLRAVALRLCRNPIDAEDLLQETYERGLRSFDRLDESKNARAWLTRIMHNRFIDMCRAQRRKPRHKPLDDIQLAAPATEPEPAWASLTTDDLVSASKKLDSRFREVFELFELHKLSYQEIAERLGIPTRTVGTRLTRARRKLRDILSVGDAGNRQEVRP